MTNCTNTSGRGVIDVWAYTTDLRTKNRFAVSDYATGCGSCSSRFWGGSLLDETPTHDVSFSVPVEEAETFLTRLEEYFDEVVVSPIWRTMLSPDYARLTIPINNNLTLPDDYWSLGAAQARLAERDKEAHSAEPTSPPKKSRKLRKLLVVLLAIAGATFWLPF
jgi:hypothetical protein